MLPAHMTMAAAAAGPMAPSTVYPLGIPLLFTYIVWRCNSQKALAAAVVDSSARFVAASHFLSRPYTPRSCYWETVECLRRLMLTGFLVFIAPGQTYAQKCSEHTKGANVVTSIKLKRRFPLVFEDYK